MPPRADAPPAATTVRRFTPAQRWAHRAVALLIEDCYRRKQPILVGTVSIEKSEQLSEILKAHTFELDGKTIHGIPHQAMIRQHPNLGRA